MTTQSYSVVYCQKLQTWRVSLSLYLRKCSQTCFSIEIMKKHWWNICVITNTKLARGMEAWQWKLVGKLCNGINPTRTLNSQYSKVSNHLLSFTSKVEFRCYWTLILIRAGQGRFILPIKKGIMMVVRRIWCSLIFNENT